MRTQARRGWIGVVAALAGLSLGCSSEDGDASMRAIAPAGGFPTGTAGTAAPTPLAPTAGVAAPPTAAPTATAGTGATPTAGAPAPVQDPLPPIDTAGTPAVDEPVESPTGPTPMGADHCLAGITNFDSAGPFDFSSETAGRVNLWVPNVPAGCMVPVIHLANGTGARCSTYGSILQRFASHGFLTACYEDTNTGAGSQGLEALQTAVSMYPDLADMRFGSTGHSQGGQAAFTVLQLAEEAFGDQAIYAGLAMEPASGFGTQPSGGTWQSVYGRIRSPMFMFSGTADILVSASWVGRAFSALDSSIEAYWWSAAGATHIPTPNAETMEVGVPWFRWKLLGDQEACRAFKALRDTPAWSAQEEQNEVPCQ